MTATSAPTPLTGLGYVLVFGVGSILGMAALSAVIAVPLAFTAKFLTWANRAVQGATGLATVALGVYVMVETSPLGL